MPLVLLELNPVAAVVDTTRHPRQTGHEALWLQADTHLVSVVLATHRGSVNAGADLHAQDQPCFCDRPRLFGSVRVREAGGQGFVALDDQSFVHKAEATGQTRR